jgi:hypothetical protein
MNNTGLDVQLIYHQIWNDFSFEATAAITTYNNEIVKIAEGIEYFDATQSGGARIGSTTRNEVGFPVGSFYGYDYIGLFQEDDLTAVTDADGNVSYVPASDDVAVQADQAPGYLRFADQDGDGEITPDDRVHIGDPNPDFTYSLNLVLGYKGFDLTAFFYGSQGNDILNQNLWWLDFWQSFQGQKSSDLLYDSWTPDNTDARVPKASNDANFSTNQEFNTYYLEDGSFFRLKNLQIGYNFGRVGNVFDNLRVYVQGTNLFTITKYSGLDPELYQPNETVFGVDQGNLPASKQFIVGVNLGF